MSGRYPWTRWFIVLSVVVGLVCCWLAHLLAVLFDTWFLVFIAIYALTGVVVSLVVRAFEDHESGPTFWTRIYSSVIRICSRFVMWHRLPTLLGSIFLLGYRFDLRSKNLHDTSSPNREPLEWEPEFRSQRTVDGTFNDLEDPHMGSAGTRFGRNTPLDKIKPVDTESLLQPSPREVSRRLMTRDNFVPATTLNLLAAAWIQFQNHDWFNHRRLKETAEIPLKPGDDWHENPMRIERTEPDPTQLHPPTFVNEESHWWDASQIYGSTKETMDRLRTKKGGRMKILKNGLLPLQKGHDVFPIDDTGFNDNWWVGLSMLHTLFVMEHNAICQKLESEYPGWSDEQLFQTARLINAALIARIHTVEWTPGILAHPVLEVAMNTNWWGRLGERFQKAFGRVSPSETISGIMGSEPEHHAAPYYLTEEFVAVYRLHPLIPDVVPIRSLKDHSLINEMDFTKIQGPFTRDFMENHSMLDLFYSMGVQHPGAVTLHNFPRALQNLEKVQEGKIDLAAIDIFRDRERGIPRYNDFREMLRLPRIKSFKKLTNNPVWAREIEELYGDIDKVDLMVGLYAEPLPEGFGFSDTAFRIFILMASRRLKSDRFFTVDFRPQIYTQIGIDWVNNNTMLDVLKRHFPELTPAIHRSKNAFAPWSRVT